MFVYSEVCSVPQQEVALETGLSEGVSCKKRKFLESISHYGLKSRHSPVLISPTSQSEQRIGIQDLTGIKMKVCFVERK